MTFFEDPRLRQRWNQISHTTEAVTENAAAGIWTFGHTYIHPCLSSITATFDGCTSVCLGDREERARRARERQRARGRAEYSFDFYDDWDEELGGQDGGLLGGWRSEDWDHLLAGTGKKRGPAGEVQEQPRTRKRGMSYGTSYGTRGPRRKASGQEEDPTVIPSTAPIGFLARLPFKIGGTLRYKPSAANLQEHPGAARRAMDGEREPLLGAADGGDGESVGILDPDDLPTQQQFRKRSGTAGSGDTSDSYRSRGDLFPSDGEGDEDAIPLDDEFTISLDHIADDRSSNKTKSSKGKRIADYRIPRSVSRTTIDSATPSSPALVSARSLESLQVEEEQAQQEEDESIEKKRHAAADLALRRGLSRENLQIASVPEAKSEMVEVDAVPLPEQAIMDETTDDEETERRRGSTQPDELREPPASRSTNQAEEEFVPARLPYFR
ncbi:hypothetical protein F4778DRAFT_659839 [Xylariomycetidae sp. FL2044]|nr:hypothetical protein F4778DRAFT_659839 [Xylariomycetidae sp. FL2044]